MSTKTIAVEQSVYEKLRLQKRDSESFTRTINRLIETSREGFTCATAVKEAASLWEEPLSSEDEKILNDTLESGRQISGWDVERPE